MSEFFSLSEAASLAIHGMGLLAMGDRMSAREMASILDVSEAHLAKVFQRLSRSGLVTSTRGPGGGFDLALPPGEISLFEIYAAIEGEPEGEHCLFRKDQCPFGRCIFGLLPGKIIEEFTCHLKMTTLGSIKSANGGKKDLPPFDERTVAEPSPPHL